ncbi:MAG: cellulase family glycosylhydrolase [Anaerolineae bacterium]|nr:cellulase family glycosylhydrolase [Anaerolineae bacterium]
MKIFLGSLFFRLLGFVAVCGFLSACEAPPTPENTSGLEAVTAVPTLDMSDSQVLCAAVEANWEQDWELAIRALEALYAQQTDCPNSETTLMRLYHAQLGYGATLAENGQTADAIEAYQSALWYNPAGEEVIHALEALGVYTPPPLQATCPDETVTIPDYTPTRGQFVKTLYSVLAVENQPLPIYGLDYYPRDTPYRRFLTETDPSFISDELDLIREAGFNTLRLKLQHSLLFTCSTPQVENLLRLDGIIQAAAERGFRVILVLNDLADRQSLYSQQPIMLEQMAFLAGRYRDEPALLAWDLREGGDVDYLENGFDRRDVLKWLVETAIVMRRIDPNHLITASWTREPQATIPAVDFVSFTHFGTIDDLRQKIALVVNETDKPILLSAFGFSTFGTSETNQRDYLQAALDAVQANRLAGWVVWTAFDFPLTVTCYAPDCINTDSVDHHYGLWHTDYRPKLAVDVVRAAASR